MRCGLHYVRFCDLRTKRCAAAPTNRAAAKAIADALAGGPLTRRKVHAFAKHPSGSRPGAPGARLASDVITLDPHASRSAGPAYPGAQNGDPEGQDGGIPGGDPQQVLVAEDPGHQDALGPPEPPGSSGQGEPGPGHEVQNGGPRPLEGVSTGGSRGGHGPTSARAQEDHASLGLERDRVSPSESGQGGERGGRPRGVRCLLGLKPEAGAPSGPIRAPPNVRKNRGPAQPKAKRAPRGPADQRARKPKRLPGPSGDPRGHIQRWLVPGVAAEHMGQEGGPASKDHAPLRSSPLTDCGTGPQPGPGSVPGVPGSSTDPPRYFPQQCPGPRPR